jgi:hypothetical protein
MLGLCYDPYVLFVSFLAFDTRFGLFEKLM